VESYHVASCDNTNFILLRVMCIAAGCEYKRVPALIILVKNDGVVSVFLKVLTHYS
jgi:hypothetical protein